MYFRKGEEELWREVIIKRKRPSRSGRAQNIDKYPRPLEILKEFSQGTTVHGVRYITREDANLFDRVVWSAAFLVCLSFAIFFMLSAWKKFVQSPIVTTVEDTYYPLYKLPFPAVTICPNNNVRRTIGEKLLKRYLNGSVHDEHLDNILINVMRTLSFLRYPYYHLMKSHLNKVKYMEKFNNLNMTDFMMQVLPNITDIFHRCTWQGREIDCMSIFELQRYEGGFCYAFNSLSSEVTKDCNDVGKSVILGGKKDRDLSCILFHNAASGTTTGLEVFFIPINNADSLGNEDQIPKGFRILLHDPDQFPEAGNGMFMSDRGNKVATVKVLPSVTESSPSLRSMKPQERNCYFEDEMSLSIYHSYSRESCLIECRLNYIIQQCNCQPYFFSNPKEHLRFFSTPSGSRVVNSITGNENSSAPNCTICLPTCSNTNYDIDTSFTEDSKPEDNVNISYLNVYYKETSAVKYFRAPAVDKMQLIVSFGGIAGLFLGISLLTGVEILYYLAKMCKSVYYHYYKEHKHKVKPKFIPPTPCLQIHVRQYNTALKINQNQDQEKTTKRAWPLVIG